MTRLYSIAAPVLLLTAALPTIPTLAPLPPSSGIVATADGTVYFVDVYHSTVWRARPGDGVRAFVTGRRSRSLQVDNAGNLYGTHADPRGGVVMWRADGDGNVTELNRTPLPHDHAHAFAITDADDIVGWSGRRSGARFWRSQQHAHDLAADEWGNRASQRVGTVTGMAPLTGGDVVVTAGATILRIAPDGSVTTVVANEPLLRPRQSLLSRLFGAQDNHLTGITVCEAGQIFVANSALGVVLRVDAQGRVSNVHTSEAGWKPTGVAYANDAVYVLEYGVGVRVQRIAPDGSRSVIAAVRSPRGLAMGSLQARFGNLL
jgi:hypothetical protein